MNNGFPTRKTLLLAAVAAEGGLGVVAVALGYLVGWAPLDEIDWTLSAALWGTAAGVSMLALLAACVHVPCWPFSDMLRVVDEQLVPMFRPCGLLDIALISALAGLGEELLFRGLIQAALAGWIGGPTGAWVGLIVASLLFGAAHPLTRSYVVLAAGMGFFLGWLLIVSDNLLTPILAHGVYDFLALVYIAKFRGRRSPRQQRLGEADK